MSHRQYFKRVPVPEVNQFDSNGVLGPAWPRRRAMGLDLAVLGTWPWQELMTWLS